MTALNQHSYIYSSWSKLWPKFFKGHLCCLYNSNVYYNKTWQHNELIFKSHQIYSAMSVSDPLIKQLKGGFLQFAYVIRCCSPKSALYRSSVYINWMLLFVVYAIDLRTAGSTVTDGHPFLQPFCQTLEMILRKGLNGTPIYWQLQHGII